MDGNGDVGYTADVGMAQLYAEEGAVAGGPLLGSKAISIPICALSCPSEGVTMPF